MSSVLEDYRFKPGAKLKTEFGQHLMVLHLATGMIRDGGGPTGGLSTVAVVDLRTGRCGFEHNQTEVRELD